MVSAVGLGLVVRAGGDLARVNTVIRYGLRRFSQGRKIKFLFSPTSHLNRKNVAVLPMSLLVVAPANRANESRLF